jgi:hypothetical protein
VRIGGTGHRLLPPATVTLVESAVRDALSACAPGDLVGLCCVADGGDRIFADAILAMHGILDLIVPSVGYREGLPVEHWPVYDRLIGQAHSVRELPHPASVPEAHMAASRIIVDSVDLLMAIWDGRPAREFGGTADVVAYARDRGVPVRVIWPVGSARD